MIINLVSTFQIKNSWEERDWNSGHIPSLLAWNYDGFGRHDNKNEKWSCWQDTYSIHCEIRGMVFFLMRTALNSQAQGIRKDKFVFEI